MKLSFPDQTAACRAMKLSLKSRWRMGVLVKRSFHERMAVLAS